MIGTAIRIVEPPGPPHAEFARIGRFVTNRPKRTVAAAGPGVVLAGR